MEVYNKNRDKNQSMHDEIREQNAKLKDAPLKEKIAFFKKKWLHEHIATIVLCVAAWIGIMIWTTLKLRGSDAYALLGAIGSMLAILFYVVLYNRMMAYVENRAYRAAPDRESGTKKP